MYRDRYNTVIGASHFSPTESVITTLGNKGMRRRLGTEHRSPVALIHSHVAFNQEFRARQYDGRGDDWLYLILWRLVLGEVGSGQLMKMCRSSH
jgi:type VI protein secretion system component VasK